MAERIYYPGRPPHVGWWLSKRRGSLLTSYWRWWNGEYWGGPAMESDSAEQAAEWAAQRSPIRQMLWSDYYPTGARVPRVNLIPWARG